jgi:hypothetical protein
MIRCPPLIPDTKGSGARLWCSVMIPTYNARAEYLEETLRTVLQQESVFQVDVVEVANDVLADWGLGGNSCAKY